MDKPVEMLQDQRTVVAACWEFDPADGNPLAYRVGQYGVTRIEVYGEPSHYCARPFLAIYKGGDQPWRRIDAAGSFVTYAEPHREGNGNG